MALIAALVVGIVTHLPAPADAACGEFYRVKRGDTLRSIAIRQMRTEDYEPIFRANRDIVSDAALIEIGQLLYLPCAGRGPRDRRAALAAAGITPTRVDNLGDRLAAETPGAPEETAEAPAALPLSEPGAELRVLTGSGLAPLADRDLPGQGMANLILNEALTAAKVARPVELAFVDDWKAHLPVLMPTGAFSLGLPWPRPDCDAGRLSATARKLCDEFLFSEPLYEIQISTIVEVGNPLALARSPGDLQGRKVCRPEGFPPVDLESLKLGLDIVAARSASECAAMLTGGEVDAVSLPEAAATRLLAEPAFAGRLIRAQYLGASVPVHALALKDAPGSRALIQRVDEGLAELQSSGRWLEVVSSYLRDLEQTPRHSVAAQRSGVSLELRTPELMPPQLSSPQRRWYSIFGQQSMMTWTPFCSARFAAFSSTTPICIQIVSSPRSSRTSSASSTTAPASSDRRKISTIWIGSCSAGISASEA